MAQFDLYSIYNSTFGFPFVRGKYSNSVEPVQVDISAQYSNVNSEITVVSEQVSMLGTPLLMPMKIGEYWLPVEPITTINLKKRIIETELDNVDGSFKEGFRKGDYEITIQGFIMEENDFEQESYPEKAMRKFKDIVTRGVTTDSDGRAVGGRGNLEITHKALNLLGIYKIVIYECEWVQVPGQIGLQGYTLTCKSDRTRSLVLK